MDANPEEEEQKGQKSEKIFKGGLFQVKTANLEKDLGSHKRYP